MHENLIIHSSRCYLVTFTNNVFNFYQQSINQSELQNIPPIKRRENKILSVV